MPSTAYYSPRYYAPGYWSGSYHPNGGAGSGPAPTPAPGAYYASSYYFRRYWSPLYYPHGIAAGPAPVVTDFRAALVAHMGATAAIAALVGTRIYPLFRPQGSALPCIVWQVISIPRDYHLAGASNLPVARVQIKSVGLSLEDAKLVAKALGDTFGDNFVGTLGGNTAVTSVALDNEHDDYAFPDNKSDVGTFFISQDYQFRFREVR